MRIKINQQNRPETHPHVRRADKNFKTIVITVLHMLKRLIKDMAYLIKIQIKLLEMKTILSKMKNTLDKTSGLEDIAVQNIQNGT